MTSASSILNYWRTSLADASLLGISASVLAEPGRSVSLFRSALQQGQVKLEYIQKVLKSELKDLKHGALLAPIVLVPRVDHGSARRGGIVVPLWIPVNVGQDGKLSPVSSSSPWMPRELLEPIERSHDLPTLGDLADHDAFVTQNPSALEGGWSGLWAWSQALFEAVTGQTIESFELEGYEVQAFQNPSAPKVLLVALESPSFRPEGALLRTYDNLATREWIPGLAFELAQLTPRPVRPLLSGDAFLSGTARHFGQMSEAFPLSPSQRESLVHFFDMGPGHVLAVNGPPGTGKTTLLQSVIASLVVQHALAGGDPALILATSTNNTAVTNVIDSFRTSAEDPFAARWLPGTSSYGLYWPAGKKEQEAQDKGFQYVAFSEQGDFPATIGTRTYFDSAKAHFLDAFEANLRVRPAGIPEAVRDLHHRLSNLATRLQQLPSAYLTAREAQALDLQPELRVHRASLAEAEAAVVACQGRLQAWATFQTQVPWWMGVFAFLPGVRAQLDARARSFASLHGLEANPATRMKDVEALLHEHLHGWRAECSHRAARLEHVEGQERQRLNELAAYQTLRQDLDLPMGLMAPEQDLLDKTVRYRAFHLSCHYWEARWLLAREQDFDPAAPSVEPQRSATPEGRLDFLKRLAMLAPCSVATLYRVPSVLSCSRPFRPLLEALDLLIIDEAGQVSPEVGGAAFAFAKNALVVGDTLQIEPVWNIPERVDRGNITGAGFEVEDFPPAFMASKGNLMGVAQMASPFWKHPKRGGMFLSEHRRCVRSLISYCNDLAYGGHLEPKREDPETPGVFPIWGYAHVPGWSEKKHGKSLGNPMEAAAIAQWIQDHQTELETLHKSGQLKDAVAVVAPFGYQKELVLKELRARDLPEITVGTVHALQGAERPLVIFSPTCTRMDPRPFFFDRGPSMLNVAVSRAKDSFLVFGDMEIFEARPGSKLPSALLAKYLFRSSGHALEGYGLPEPAGGVRDLQMQAERIASLEGHRKALA